MLLGWLAAGWLAACVNFAAFCMRRCLPHRDAMGVLRVRPRSPWVWRIRPLYDVGTAADSQSGDPAPRDCGRWTQPEQLNIRTTTKVRQPRPGTTCRCLPRASPTATKKFVARWRCCEGPQSLVALNNAPSEAKRQELSCLHKGLLQFGTDVSKGWPSHWLVASLGRDMVVSYRRTGMEWHFTWTRMKS